VSQASHSPRFYIYVFEGLVATDEILTDNGVRSQGSPDTLAVWMARPAK